MIGANDAQDFLGPPDVPYTSPQWNTLYAQRVAQFMQIAGSGGATVVWVGMPPMQSAGLTRRCPMSTPWSSSRPPRHTRR